MGWLIVPGGEGDGVGWRGAKVWGWEAFREGVGSGRVEQIFFKLLVGSRWALTFEG
jgi:hypothetical protein